MRFVILLALCAILVLHALYFFEMVDDAFISFRYAENLAAGKGLGSNPGERVEGYQTSSGLRVRAPLKRIPGPRGGVKLPTAYIPPLEVQE